ncbi:MAG: hypothetical protein MUF58_22570 [Arcicella sp.]|nr:hypothetical protein [Arcicella sp.]
MRNTLFVCLLLITLFLQSCDERITPNSNTVEVKPLTNTEILTANSWQFAELVVRGGGKTIVQFSRANSINLSSATGTTKLTYKADGTFISDNKGDISTGTWKFQADEKQIVQTDARGRRQVFDIGVLNKTNFNFSQTTRKSDVGDDGLWVLVLAPLGFPATTTEIVTSFAMTPL